MNHVLDKGKVPVQPETAGTLTLTGVGTADRVELGESDVWKQTQVDYSPSIQQAHAARLRPLQISLHSQAQSEFPLEVITRHALVRVAIDTPANDSVVQPSRDDSSYLPAETWCTDQGDEAA